MKRFAATVLVGVFLSVLAPVAAPAADVVYGVMLGGRPLARLHGSELKLEDNHPGLRARMVLTQDTRPITRTARVTSEEGEFRHEPVYP